MLAPLFICVCLLTGLVVAYAAYGTKARRRVHITLNGIRRLEVSAGESLLVTLAEEGIVLPSTCGGAGACALCRCRILKGGGTISERELPFFNRTELAAGWRLACQVRVQGDVDLELPVQDPRIFPANDPRL